MSQKVGRDNSKVYRLVLTGGPCGGKTTGQARLCTFFENLGWKVYRVPETASVLLGGGIKWHDLTHEEVLGFQDNLIKTMMQVENTFFDLASSCRRNCLVICDRGIMDGSAYLKPKEWEKLKEKNNWNEVDLRDSRYNLVIHMVSAAIGAEDFYRLDNNSTRTEGIEIARQLDKLTAQAWVGHPYYDVIDNSTDFERKVVRMIAAVCNRLGIEAGDRLSVDSKKRKFLVNKMIDDSDHFQLKINGAHGLTDEKGISVVNSYPQFQDFIVVHDYLVTPNHHMQARIRRRGQNVRWDVEKHCWDLETENRYQVCAVSKGKDTNNAPIFIFGTDADFSNWTYTHTTRRPEINKESPELRMQISAREYQLLLVQKDVNHYTIYKKRRCFLWKNQYFQMDIYEEPCHPRCRGLIILETYTTLLDKDLELPGFLEIIKEITKDGNYSMYKLSKKDSDEVNRLSPSPRKDGVPETITDGVI